MEGNVIDEVNHYEIKERDDPQHTRYITWPSQEVDDSQELILQPVSGNGRKKLKEKAETRHVAKEKSTNLAALKLIARQGADEKSQLEEWKTDLLGNLTAEIAQIHKVHKDAMEAQREEIEKQRKRFQFEIETLRERIWELKKEKEGSVQERIQQQNMPVPKYCTPEREPTLDPSEENATTS